MESKRKINKENHRKIQKYVERGIIIVKEKEKNNNVGERREEKGKI